MVRGVVGYLARETQVERLTLVTSLSVNVAHRFKRRIELLHV